MQADGIAPHWLSVTVSFYSLTGEEKTCRSLCRESPPTRACHQLIVVRATGIIKRLSKSEYRLKHRRPAGQTRGIRSKGAAIRNFGHPHQLAAEPQALGRKEMPLETAGIFMRVPELSEDHRSAGIQHQLPGNDKFARRQIKAVVECGRERKRPVGFKVA